MNKKEETRNVLIFYILFTGVRNISLYGQINQEEMSRITYFCVHFNYAPNTLKKKKTIRSVL
jgi:hypothetical protein